MEHILLIVKVYIWGNALLGPSVGTIVGVEPGADVKTAAD